MELSSCNINKRTPTGRTMEGPEWVYWTTGRTYGQRTDDDGTDDGTDARTDGRTEDDDDDDDGRATVVHEKNSIYICSFVL